MMPVRPSVRSAAAAALVSAALAAALPAHAAGRQAEVRIAGYDLSRPGEVARLEAQLRRAATRVCAENGVRGLAEAQAAQRCARQAVAATRPQMAAAIAAHENRALAAASVSPTTHAR